MGKTPETQTADSPTENRTARTARTREREPDPVCQCDRSKQPQHPTCFQCSGLTLCDECGENYHPVEYETCYECSRYRDS